MSSQEARSKLKCRRILIVLTVNYWQISNFNFLKTSSVNSATFLVGPFEGFDDAEEKIELPVAIAPLAPPPQEKKKPTIAPDLGFKDLLSSAKKEPIIAPDSGLKDLLSSASAPSEQVPASENIDFLNVEAKPASEMEDIVGVESAVQPEEEEKRNNDPFDPLIEIPKTGTSANQGAERCKYLKIRVPGVFDNFREFSGRIDTLLEFLKIFPGVLVPQPSLIFESKKLRNVNLPPSLRPPRCKPAPLTVTLMLIWTGNAKIEIFFYYQKILPGIPGFKY